MKVSLRVKLGIAAAVLCIAQSAAGAIIDSTIAVNGDSFDGTPFDGTFEAFLGSGGVGLFEKRTFREIRWVLEFTTGSMKAGDSVGSAFLDFNFQEILGVPSEIEIHTFAGNGLGEASDAQTLNLLASILPTSGPQSLDVTSHIQTSLNAGIDYFGFFFRVIPSPSGNGNASVLRSSSGSMSGEPGLRGTFTATVPEPSTLALLGLGLVGIGLRRRVAKAS